MHQSPVRLGLAFLFLIVTASTQAATPRFLVVHTPAVGMTPEDHTAAIHDAIEDARAVNGIVEFEAGKVYRTKQIKIWKADSTTPETMPAGIEGNGAILKWKKDDTENNKSWNLEFGANCSAVDILGGYTEKGFHDQVADDWVSGVTPNSKSIHIVDAASGVDRTIRIIGGRRSVGLFTILSLTGR